MRFSLWKFEKILKFSSKNFSQFLGNFSMLNQCESFFCLWVNYFEEQMIFKWNSKLGSKKDAKWPKRHEVGGWKCHLHSWTFRSFQIISRLRFLNSVPLWNLTFSFWLNLVASGLPTIQNCMYVMEPALTSSWKPRKDLFLMILIRSK